MIQWDADCQFEWILFIRHCFSRPLPAQVQDLVGVRRAFNEDKRFVFSGGYLPIPGSVWPGRDCDSRSVRGWLHTSKPIEEQDRGQTVRERDRDRWEERWDTNTQIQRGRERQDWEIISHCISYWKMPTSIHTKRQWFHTIAQTTGT